MIPDDNAQILQHMDDEAIRWQYCAICGQQRQRIVHSPDRPDFALCGACGSAFVLEDGGQLRMFYGRIGPNLPETRAFALKQWRAYLEVRARAQKERLGQDIDPDEFPLSLPGQAPPSQAMGYANMTDGVLDLEAQQSEIFYERVKKTEPPPKRLRETGELPNLDDLFADDNPPAKS